MTAAVTDKVAAEQSAEINPALPRLGRVLGIWFAAIGFVIGSRVISDNSFFTHLATGRLILAEGSVPQADPYSFTAAAEPWVVQSWLVSVIYAVGLGIGDWTLRVMHGVLAAAAAFGLWRLTESTKNILLRVLVVGLAMGLAASLWVPRPLLFAVVGFVAVQLVLDGKLKPIWLVPIMWVWVNSHGSFPMAGVLAGTTMVGAFLDSRKVPSHEVKVLAYVTLGTALGALNPIGFKLLWFPVELLSQSTEKLHNVTEWQPLGFGHPTVLWPLVALCGLMVWAVVRGARWRELVPVAVFTMAAFMALRNAGMAALVLTAAVAPWLPELGGTLRSDTRSVLSKALGVVAIAFGLIGLAAPFVQGAFDLQTYPDDEISWLEDRGLIGNENINVIAEVKTGNLLTLRYGAEARVFFDDRFDMYPLSINQDYDLLIGTDTQAFAEVLDRYEADVVLWEADQPLTDWLISEPGWVLGTRSQGQVVLCRSGIGCE